MAPTNAALLEGCKGGDNEAWAAIVSRYERLVYAIPLREGLDGQRAAEVAQDTFLALLNSLERIQQPERLGY